MNKDKIIFFLIVILLIIYAYSFSVSYTFDFVYSLYSDNANLYFLQSLSDDSVFHNDLLSMTFKESFSHSSIGFVIARIYAVLSKFLPFAIATKILSQLLCFFTVMLIYKIGVALYSKRFALLSAGLFLVYFLTMDSFYGYGGRCFGITLFCAFLYYFIREKFLFLPFILILTILFYPPIFVILLMTCILIIIFSRKRLSELRVKKLFILLLTFAALISMILTFQGTYTKNATEKMATTKLYQSYKYSQCVKSLINPNNPLDAILYFVFNLNEHDKLYIYFTVFLLISCLSFIVCRKKKAFNIPSFLWIMLLASSLSFTILYPFHPPSASRQFVFSFPLFLIYFFSINLSEITKQKLNPFLFLIPVITIFIILHPLFNSIEGCKKYKDIYQQIKTFPKNSIIAGYPDSTLINTIPFFTKRTIFPTHETNDMLLLLDIPINELLDKQQLLMDSLYSYSRNDIKKIVSEFKIDYFVVETKYYEESFVKALRNSIDSRETKLFDFISNKKDNEYFLKMFSTEHHDFKFKLDDDNYIFILNANKI